jgi:dihydrodipicolinate synthase/N-acetylneuraminate lyase
MFSGLIPAMVTPFNERREVDLTATEAVIEHLSEAGVSGISPLGSTGEFSRLLDDERRRFAEEVIRFHERRGKGDSRKSKSMILHRAGHLGLHMAA